MYVSMQSFEHSETVSMHACSVHVHVYMGTCVPTRLLNHAHLANVPITGLDKLLEEELKWLLTVRVSAGSGSGALSLPPSSLPPSSFTRSLTHSFTYSLPRPPSIAPPPSPLPSPPHRRTPWPAPPTSVRWRARYSTDTSLSWWSCSCSGAPLRGTTSAASQAETGSLR